MRACYLPCRSAAANHPRYRLYSLQIIWVDIRAAAAEDRKIESCLWQTHVNITKTYRKVISWLHEAGLAVLKRKVEKQYTGFLMLSLSFYRAYLQRFCGHFKVKGLDRVARKVKFDDPLGPAEVPSRNADPEVLELVNASFHRTLIYLGDLSRYRALVRSKDRSFETALTYYTLANELMPESGYGYHQSGVIYAEAENHLEIVYNMYRAMACDRPHPLAKQNLEREFRDLRQQKGGGGAKGSLDAMVNWFVKLHAFYYKGDEFPGRKELEGEVDHRLAMTLKADNEGDVDKILLKMVLINITAYVAGMAGIQTDWTDARSRSCQFVLQLNARTIYTISRLLSGELEDIVQQKPLQAVAKDAAVSAGGGNAVKFTPTFCRILPLFRVYMTWLCFYTSDLDDYREHLQPQFGNMCKSLAHTLTLLLDLLTDISDKTSVSWLFPEDEETIGMKCLNGPELYEGCQLRYDALEKKLKPPADEVSSADRTADNAASVRVFDAVLCGLRLSQDSSFPIILSEGSKSFSYVEGVKPSKAAWNPSMAQSHGPPVDSAGTLAAAAPLPAAVLTPKEPAPNMPAAAAAAVPVATDSEDFSDDGEFYRPAVANTRDANRQPTVAPDVAVVASGSEFPIDTQLFQILNEFLVPPERPAGQAEPGPEDTSYGMGSKTAAEVFGAASTSPAPGSATSKTFPSLPWNYFFPTAPKDPSLRDLGTLRSPSNGWDSRPASSGSPRGAPGVPRMSESFASRSGEPVSQARLSGSFAASPFAYHGPQDWAAQTALASMAVRDQSLQAQNIRQMWPEASSGSASHSKKSSSLSSPSGPWQQGTSQVPVATGHPAQNSPFSLTGFSADSSLPPVNSAWGVPMAHAQAYPYQGQQSPGFPGSFTSMHTSGYSPSMPPGLSGLQGTVYGNGAGYDLATTGRGDGGQNFPIHRSHADVAPQDYERQAAINSWSNYQGPRSAGAGTFDSSVPRVDGSNRIVPVVPTMPHLTSAKGTRVDWNGKPKPK